MVGSAIKCTLLFLGSPFRKTEWRTQNHEHTGKQRVLHQNRRSGHYRFQRDPGRMEQTQG